LAEIGNCLLRKERQDALLKVDYKAAFAIAEVK
jgi:hypothetical protein